MERLGFIQSIGIIIQTIVTMVLFGLFKNYIYNQLPIDATKKRVGSTGCFGLKPKHDLLIACYLEYIVDKVVLV